jgi:hypothetical protein
VPNADGTRKSCGNCSAWADRDQRCVIHKADQEIVADEICGYHVFGTPQLFYVQEPAGALDPRLSGLELVIGGASCDTCRYYDGGNCVAVADPVTNRPPTRVDALGCCTRWARIE